MAVNPGDQATRIYIGTGARGMSLRQTFDALAEKYKNGSLSKLLVDAVIEKYGINPETGAISNHRKPKR